MVSEILESIWTGITSLAVYVFDVFDRVGSIGYIVAFSIIGIFVSFIISNKLSVTSRLGDHSDRVKRW